MGDLLLVSNTTDPDLAAAVATSRKIAAQQGFSVRQVDGTPAAIELLNAAPDFPWLIVIAQSWPGQTAAAEIDLLRRAAPLAIVCGLLGSWCEGETRSGKPWPNAFREAWNNWPVRMAREARQAALGLAGAWSLPATSATEEFLLAAALPPAGGDSSRQGNGVTIAIVAESAAARTALADAAQVWGYRPTIATLGKRPSTLRAESATAAKIVLWDTTVIAINDTDRVLQAADLAPGAPIVAIVGFPRAEDFAKASAAGIDAVIAKPYLLSDLFWRVSELQKAGRQSSAAID
jgi:CheY-like chemotaxis protein